MIDPDEIVITKPQIRVSFSYPLGQEHIFKLTAPTGKDGFSRAGLAAKIARIYQYIYQEEEKTSPTTEGQESGLLNRAQTEGRFGIWGHELGDLVLDSVWFDAGEDVYRLRVCS